jgi:hypothetical protein
LRPHRADAAITALGDRGRPKNTEGEEETSVPKIVYRVFKDETAVNGALGRLRALQGSEDSDEAYNAIVYRGEFRREDVQLGGTQAFRGGIFGGVVVGILGGFIAQFLIWPMAGVDFGWSAMLLVMFAGSTFGVISGALAGASAAKDGLQRDADRAYARGELLLVCEAEHRSEVPKIEAALRDVAPPVAA